MKRLIVPLTGILVLASLSWAAEFKYVGSSNSKKYHRPDCEWAQKIPEMNRVTFQTARQAVDLGFKPCKVCRPPKLTAAKATNPGPKEVDLPKGDPAGTEIPGGPAR